MAEGVNLFRNLCNPKMGAKMTNQISLLISIILGSSYDSQAFEQIVLTHNVRKIHGQLCYTCNTCMVFYVYYMCITYYLFYMYYICNSNRAVPI